VQYLWLDALCIIQDDAEDWLHESAQMSAVYAQAFLTVSASSVASSRLSFLHQSRGNKGTPFEFPNDTATSTHAETENSHRETGFSLLGVTRSAQSGFHQEWSDAV
jgi:hypothetical protein